jgi:filamentous hemagglutinin family protein
MNACSYKTVFSKRLGALVAVGEHASSQGKANGAGSGGGAGASGTLGYIAALTASFALVSLAWAAPATNALPTAGQVVQGAASMSQTASQMTIHQGTQRAAINWQSFDIGAQAKVQVVQPNAQAVLLNRVVGQSPSQIFGQLQANGHVILVNPNGVLFGKDGSVNAASFTASTLGISDANFMAGNMVYERNGSTAGIVNDGTITTAPGGYVALLGASVSNQGKIDTQGGNAFLGAADTIKVPVSSTGRIKLELTAADMNANVSNTGSIITQGGQVYMQALALNQAAAQIIQSGSIDTTGEKGGAVNILADGGKIRVSGSVKANSTNGSAGGDVYIGRDKDTNVLAAVGDASGARLESKGGFVETSGKFLAVDGIKINADTWLLDPDNIEITDGTVLNAGYSKIKASDISNALNTTNVVISTTLGATPVVPIPYIPLSTSADGNIVVNTAITKTGTTGLTKLTLNADNGITLNEKISSTGSALDVEMTALGNAPFATNSKGIVLNKMIDANGGVVTLTGTNKNTIQSTSVLFNSGVVFNSGSGINAGSFTVDGTATTIAAANHGVLINGGTSFTSSSSSVVSEINGKSVSNSNGVNAGTNINGTGVSFTALNGGSMVVKGSNTASKLGLRVSAAGDNTTITTNGNVTLGALEANSNFSIRAGSITANSGSLKILGSTVSNYGGETITANNGINIYIEGKPTDGSNAVSFISTGALPGITIKALAATGGTAGNVEIVGTASTGIAVGISSNSVIEAANVTIKGTSGTGAAVNGAGKITATAGKVDVIGKSDTKSTVVTNINANITATGDVKVEGTGAAKHGIFSNGYILSTGGSITLLGDTTLGSGTGVGSGVGIGGGGSMNAANDITITGKTFGDNAVNVGVLTAGRDITIEGTSQYKNGILINNAVTATGVVKMTGDITANLQNSSYQGIYVAKNVTGGAVWMKGTSEGSTGVDINAKVESTSATAVTSGLTPYNGVTLIGKGGNGPWSNQGVWTRGAGSIVSASTVDIKGDNTYAANNGNMMGAQIQGTVTAAGDIKIEGNAINPASPNRGLVIENLVKSTGGDITVKGTVTNGQKVAVVIAGTNAALITENGSKSINMTADTVDFAGAKEITAGTGADTGKGTVNITSLTAGKSIKLGMDEGYPVAPELRLNQTELNKITAGNVVIGDTKSGYLEVSAPIKTKSTTGNITLNTGNNIVVKGLLEVGDDGAGATKNLTLNGAGASSTVTQSAAIKAAGLELLGANATHTLTNAGNQVATLAANTKAVDYFNSGALTLGSVNTDGINASGDVSIATGTGNLTIAKNVATTATSATALKLNAAKSAGVGAAVVSDNSGNIIVNGGSVSVGTGGTAQLMTGSITGDTTAAALANAGNFRYNSDETTTNYSKTLSTNSGGNNGINVIYREKPTVTIQVNNVTKVYDGIAHSGGSFATTAVATGLQNGDTDAMAGANAVFAGSAQGVKDVLASSGKKITAADNGKNALGYGVTYTEGSLTINRATLQEVNAAKIYDGLSTVTGSQLTSIKGVGSETFTAAATDSAAITGKDVTTSNNKVTSTSGLNLTGNATTTLATNYDLGATPVASAVTINKAKLQEVNAAKTYDGASTVTGSQLTSIKGIGTETFTAAATDSAAITGKDVTTANNKVTSTSGLNLTGNATTTLATNYDLTATPVASTVTIGKATLALSLADQTKVYDGKLDAAIKAGDITATGVTVGGNTEKVSLKAVTGAYNDKNVANASAVLATVSASDVNTATAANGLDLGNYTLSDTSATQVATNSNSKITKATLALSLADQTKVYSGTVDAAIAAAQVSAKGVTVNGQTESATFNAVSGSYNSKNVADTQTVSTTVRASDVASTANNLDLNNYTLSNTNAAQAVTGKGAITKANLTVTLADQTKTYDGTTVAALIPSAFTVKGVTVAGQTESASVNQTVALYNDKNVLGASSVTANLAAGNFAAATGTDLNNYNVPTSVTANGTITPRPLTIAVGTVADKKADGTTTATVTPGALEKLVDGESLKVLVTAANFSDANAGTGKVVTASYALQNGTNGLASNYILNANTPNPDSRLRGTISTSVNPVINPTPSPVNNNGVSRVRTVSGFGGAGAATGVLDDQPANESREVCSDLYPENCECQPSVIPTIEICFAPKRVVANKEEK